MITPGFDEDVSIGTALLFGALGGLYLYRAVALARRDKNSVTPISRGRVVFDGVYSLIVMTLLYTRVFDAIPRISEPLIAGWAAALLVASVVLMVYGLRQLFFGFRCMLMGVTIEQHGGVARGVIFNLFCLATCWLAIVNL